MRNKILAITITVLILSSCGDSINNEGSVITTDPEICSSQDSQNQALWNYLNKDYFWNEKLDIDTNPSQFSSLADLIDDVRAKVDIDSYSFVMSEQKYQDDFVNAEFFGYGLGTALNKAKNELKIRFVYNDSNAAKMGLTRGGVITMLNGQRIEDAISQGTYESGDIWGPNENGYVSSVIWTDTNGIEHEGEMSRSTIQTNTVMATQVFSTTMGKAGYLVFNSFVERSANDLNIAFNFLKKENVTELVLDLRYNSGGYITIARQLASQIGGANVIGNNMLSYKYNSNNSFSNSDLSFELGQGQEQLNLTRVVILTTDATASASEMVANALTPYIDVKLVGSKTFGKPVGTNINKLCDHRIFAINFQTINANGFGDYFDGLPVDCAAEDNIEHNWGDQRDPLLNEALYLINNNSCSNSKVESTQITSKSLYNHKLIDNNIF